MNNIDLSKYEPHWGFGHPTAGHINCPWCNGRAEKGEESKTVVNDQPQPVLLYGEQKSNQTTLQDLTDRAERARLLDQLEHERLKVAGCSTAATGYWKEGDPLHPDIECAAIHDVAKLYHRLAQVEEALIFIASQSDKAGNWAVELAKKTLLHCRATD